MAKGYVYLLGDWEKDGVYKIGVTRGKVENRIKELQTGNSGEIFLVSSYESSHPFKMEKMLHQRYYGKKVLNEWFSLTADEVIKFKKDCEDIQQTLEVLERDNYWFRKKCGLN